MDLIGFQPYLKSLPNPANQEGSDRYTPTEAQLPLKVQTVVLRHDDPDKQQQKAPQRSHHQRQTGIAGFQTAPIATWLPGVGKDLHRSVQDRKADRSTDFQIDANGSTGIQRSAAGCFKPVPIFPS